MLARFLDKNPVVLEWHSLRLVIVSYHIFKNKSKPGAASQRAYETHHKKTELETTEHSQTWYYEW
jgi:hypothetical protein